MEQHELFMPGTMTLGVNYWASHAATRMWRQWDESVVAADLAQIAAMGCRVIRVFPLWSDFQPVMVLRANCAKGGYRRGYAFTDERPLPDTDAGHAGVDESMMARFSRLCDLAQQHGLRLIVPLLNGHMTFRVYNPPVVDGLDVFTDPEALMWQGKFIHYFVRRMKAHPAIAAWEIGNESNRMSRVDHRATAWSWTAFVTDAIRAEDSTRPICSGMHSLALHESRGNPDLSSWTFADQAELCDVLTAHPYPMWRGYIHCDSPNTLRWAVHAAIETQLYADLSGTGAFAEEVGTLRRTFSTFEALGENLRAQLWQLWSSDGRALLWWCAFDQTAMEFPPYDWAEPGMEHGAMTADYRVNPTGRTIARFASFLRACPVRRLPPPREKAVCILGRDQKLYEVAIGTGILARQAGLPLQFSFCEAPLPDARVYLIPCAHNKAGLSRAAYRALAAKAEAGATVYMSFDADICVPEMESFFGFEIADRVANAEPLALQPDGMAPVVLRPPYRFTMKSHGAVPLDPAGLMWSYRRGKGQIIAVAMPIEQLMLDSPGSYQKYPAFELYRRIGAVITAQQIVRVADPGILVSEHPESDDVCDVLLCNCDAEPKTVRLSIRPGWAVSEIYADTPVSRCGDTLTLANNAGCLLRCRTTP